MNITRSIAVCVALLTSGSVAAASDLKRISTEDDFRKLVVGKKIKCGDKDHYTIRRNGRLTGRFGGETLKGVWEWRDGYFCRTLTTVRPGTDCQKFEVSAKELRGTRNRGKGRSFTCQF